MGLVLIGLLATGLAATVVSPEVGMIIYAGAFGLLLFMLATR